LQAGATRACLKFGAVKIQWPPISNESEFFLKLGYYWVEATILIRAKTVQKAAQLTKGLSEIHSLHLTASRLGGMVGNSLMVSLSILLHWFEIVGLIIVAFRGMYIPIHIVPRRGGSLDVGKGFI